MARIGVPSGEKAGLESRVSRTVRARAFFPSASTRQRFVHRLMAGTSVVVTAKELSASERDRLNGSVMQVLSKGAFSPEQLLTYLRDRVQQHMQPAEPKS